MNGPFGVEISKSAVERRKRDDRLESAKGVGGATAGIGLLAGGIPGETGESRRWDPVHRAAPDGRKIRPKAKDVGRSLKGGILGYRIDAHQAELDGLREKATNVSGRPMESVHEFNRGLNDFGGHAPEKKIIRHLKRARRGSHVALGAGAATVAGAAYLKNKNQVKKSDIFKAEKKKRYQAQVAGGATIAGASLGGGKVLESQGNKWAQTAADEYDNAKKYAPEVGGWDNARSDHNVRHVKPHFSDKALSQMGDLGGKRSPRDLRQAGIHRGNAAKARYFADTFGNNAKWVRRVGVPVGVAGMALGSKKVQGYTDKKRDAAADRIRSPQSVKKSLPSALRAAKANKTVLRGKGSWYADDLLEANRRGSNAAREMAREKRTGFRSGDYYASPAHEKFLGAESKRHARVYSKLEQKRVVKKSLTPISFKIGNLE